MPLNVGTILNQRYRVAKLLGQGGFGAVYRAWDINLNRPCAIKENLDASPEAQRQFAREASILANLSHPNLVRVTDYFFIPGQGQYLVMDFVEGEDLESLVSRRGPLPPEQAIAWVAQVADALTYLHGQPAPVVHRDVKPANVRITPDGRAVLVDFGLAKVYDPHLRTTVGARAVTPGYSPPEQYGQGNTDARTDIYALGATLYTLLTGETPPESVQRVAGVPLAPAHQVNPRVTRIIGGAVECAMALNPGQRYQAAAEFKAALTRPAPAPAPGLPAGSPPPAMQPTGASARGNSRRLYGAIGIGAVVLVIGAIAAAQASSSAWQAQQTATAQAEMQAQAWHAQLATATAMGYANAQAQQTAIAQAQAAMQTQQAMAATLQAQQVATVQVQQTAAAQVQAAAVQAVAATLQAQQADMTTAQAQEATAQAQQAATATAQAARQAAAIARAAAATATAEVQGKTLFQDGFDSNTNGWPTGSFSDEYSEVTRQLIDGKYRMSITSKRDVIERECIPGFSVKDFLLTVNATIVKTTDQAEVGVVFRRQNNLDEYIIEFKKDSSLTSLYRARQWTQIQSMSADATKLDKGHTNTFAVRVKGPNFAGYENGQELTTATDTTLSEAGQVCLAVGLFRSDQTVTVDFDDLVVKEIP